MTTVGDRPVFTGVAVALVTLFDDTGELDAKATALHAQALAEAGARGVLVAGTTGEAFALTEPERATLLDEVRAALPAEVPVVVGTGAPSARAAARQTAQARDGGADAILALSPAGSRDLPGYYAAVAEAAGSVPVLAYHFPRASAPGVPVAALPTLPVRGIKDSADDPSRLLEEATTYDGWLYVGSSSMLPFAGSLGVSGAILALANVEVERCIRAFSGDVEAQRELAPAHQRMLAGYPRALKAMVAERYGTSTTARIA